MSAGMLERRGPTVKTAVARTVLELRSAGYRLVHCERQTMCLCLRVQ